MVSNGIGDQKDRKDFNVPQPIEIKEDLFLGSQVVSNHFCLAYLNGATIKFIAFFRDALSFAPPVLFSTKFSLCEGNSSCFVKCSTLVINTISISNVLSTLSRT